MRHTLLFTTLAVSFVTTACMVGGDEANPPLLRVTSPQRSTIQDHTGALVVTGTVARNPSGASVDRVTVNDQRATIDGDGTFSVTLDIPAGATLIHTVATDSAGGVATDTRSVEAGERRAPGSNLQNALAASISAPAFTQIGNAAGALLKTADLKALIAPMNPVVHAGDEAGPDCLFGQAFVDKVTITDAKITLAPVTGGLQFSATLDHPDIVGHALFAVACAKGSSNFEVKADSATLGGVLAFTINGTSGLASKINNPVIQTPGLAITATGIPQEILNLIPLEQVIELVGPAAVQLFVTPMINNALGTLTGPQKIQALGQTIDLQITPNAIAFDPSGGNVALDMKLLIEGAENSPGFLFTPNGMPALDAGQGLALGIADDLANEALAQITALGLLNRQLPGTNAQLQMTSPPMISADPTDGLLHLVLPDMMVSTGGGGRIAVNAAIPLSLAATSDGASLAIQLGTPAIAIDALEGTTGASGLAPAIHATTNDQKGSLDDLLKSIPLPKVMGLQLADPSVGGGHGYVLVKTNLK